jgi:hypothetical protein
MLNSEQAFACFSHYTSRDACATSGHSFLCFRLPNVAVLARLQAVTSNGLFDLFRCYLSQTHLS